MSIVDGANRFSLINKDLRGVIRNYLRYLFISLSDSRSFIDALLSCIFLPFANPILILAKPFSLKKILSGITV
jgi:hypothetical protein